MAAYFDVDSVAAEFSLTDRKQTDALLRALYRQRGDDGGQYCDVTMQTCGHSIYAHSSVLAAASPYFARFFSADLPRIYSQRSPQVFPF